MKVLVGDFNQEKALVGAFSMIVKTGCATDGSICGTNSDSYSEDTDTRLAAALLASLCHGSRLDFLFLTITFFTPLKTIELKKHHLTIYSLTDLSSIDT